MKETHTITDLEQVRLLSDPFKLQLLQAFAEAEKTAKQVAGELGEPLTKLYRHVDALLEAGLLDVTQEKRKRGAVERTFRAVARRFEADHTLFSRSDSVDGMALARDMLRATESEILQILSAPKTDPEEQAIIMRIRGRVTAKKLAELRSTLKAWLDSVTCDSAGDAAETFEIGGLIAFYEIDH